MLNSQELIMMDGISFASQLQPEIQWEILKIVVVDYLNTISDRHIMLSHLVSLMGYHSLLDTIVSMVIQELEIDASITHLVYDNSLFHNVHFEKFANFVLNRRIKLKKIMITPIASKTRR
ncbi:unnamed protein product [Ambrosiozyma monospora]|uniref:Unnamed protein product n=1 Tax=Ambrosiozyma monospora TaxID=43982 RepID=A0ACB5STY5_AMBMO|nr:unnamed protein product [Ambrosiozyma monospora]